MAKTKFEFDPEDFLRPLRRVSLGVEISSTGDVLSEGELERLTPLSEGASQDGLTRRRAEWLEEARHSLLVLEWFDQQIAAKKASQS